METKWWHSAVVYQIYPKSFCDANGDGVGDLAGIIGKLDYLQALGIQVIWLSPVFRSPMDDNGYDISDYRDIAPEFGTLAEMDSLIAEAAKRDIRIVMDLVVNHTSDEHPWFVEARKSKDNPYRDYYIWRAPRADGSAPNDFRSYFGGSGWDFDAATGEYYFHQFSRKQPDLNWDNPKVQEEVHRMMNWWLDRGIGGFRMDVIDLIGKVVDEGIMANGPRLHPLLQEMNRATFGPRDVLTVGETWSATPEIARLYSDPARNELSMVFQFEHVTLTWDPQDGKWAPRPFDLVAFKRVIAKWQTELADTGWNSLFWNNHDLPRAVSKYGDPGRYRVESAKMLATALHCLKGTPYIYQGEELGMTNVRLDSIADYRDIETLNLYRERTAAGMSAAARPPEGGAPSLGEGGAGVSRSTAPRLRNGSAVQSRPSIAQRPGGRPISHEAMMEGIYANGRDNARTPMQWDGRENAGFSTGQPWLKVNPNYREINAAAALADPDSIFHHYRRLVALRKERPVMVYGGYQPLFEAHPQVFAYQRRLGDERIVVINNFSGELAEVDLPVELQYLAGECLVSNYDSRTELGRRLALRPYESFVIAASAATA